MIKESIFLFLAVGTVINYMVTGTTSGDYVKLNLNSTWNGDLVFVKGNYSVVDLVTNFTSRDLSAPPENYCSYFSMWCGEFLGDTFTNPNVEFTMYHDTPALKVSSDKSYAIFDLQYMFPIYGKLLYQQLNQTSPINETFEMTNLPSLMENGYNGSYSEFNGKILDGSQVFGSFLGASPNATLTIGNVSFNSNAAKYQRFLSLNAEDKDFLVLILNTTGNPALAEIAQVDVNGTPYYIGVSGGEVKYLGNSNTTFPFQAFFLPNSGLLLIDYPYSGNISIVFDHNSFPSTLSLTSGEIDSSNSNLLNLLYVLIPVVLIALIATLFLVKRHRR